MSKIKEGLFSMKDYFIGHSIQLIKECNPDIEEEKIEVIQYGLLSIYLTFTKVFIILIFALFLNMLVEVLLFLILYNIIRLFSFGLHATKSWICLLSSTIVFIGAPYLCLHMMIPIHVKVILGGITIFFIFKNSPADTHKRPIVSRKRRFIYKTLSTLFSIVYAFGSIFIDNNFLANCLTLAPVVQCFVISPMVYQLFGLPYDNYKKYEQELEQQIKIENQELEGSLV